MVLDHEFAKQRPVPFDDAKAGARRANPLDVYMLDFLNTQPDAHTLLPGLTRRPPNSVLMHGPPGIGKTAFAEYVAEALGRDGTSGTTCANTRRFPNPVSPRFVHAIRTRCSDSRTQAPVRSVIIQVISHGYRSCAG